MPGTSRATRIFIGFTGLCGLTALTCGLLKIRSPHYPQFLALLVMAVAASRLKVKLPGVTGSMSVNLPFILIAVAQLSLLEAQLIALASTAAQCFPKGGKPKALQMLFNLSAMAVAVGIGSCILHLAFGNWAPWRSISLLLAPAGAAFFLVQTVPVATIISLTEGGRVLRIWSGIFHLSFPYYVLSAGIASMVTTTSHRIGWQTPLLVLPVMYGVYRSYVGYFGRSEAPERWRARPRPPCSLGWRQPVRGLAASRFGWPR